MKNVHMCKYSYIFKELLKTQMAPHIVPPIFLISYTLLEDDVILKTMILVCYYK